MPDRSPVRFLPLAVLGAIYAFVLANLVPYCLYANLLKGDGPGHLMLLTYTGRHLLPFGQGWCESVWLGFPAGQLYPPLFHVLGGALSVFTDPVAAAKAIVCATWLAMPAAALAAASGFATHPVLRAAALAAIWAGVNVPTALLGIPDALGTGMESGIGQGMFPSALGALFFLLLLWRLSPKCDPSRLLPRPDVALLLALAVTSHPMWGLVAAATAACAAIPHLAGDLVRDPPGALRPAVSWTATAALAFALTAFFTVPLAAHRDLLSAIHLPSSWTPGLWALALVILSAAAAVPGALPPAARVALPAAGLTVTAMALGDATGWRTHVFRLTVPAFVLLLPLVPAALQALANRTQRPVRAAPGAATLAAFTVLCGLFHVMGPVHPGGNPDMGVPQMAGYRADEGRVMALASDFHAPGYQALPYVAGRTGALVSHGISVESAPGARYVFGLMKKLHPGVYTWGVDMKENPAYILPDPEYSIAVRQLDALGFSHILTDLRLPAGALEAAFDAYQPALRFPNYLAAGPEDVRKLGRSFHIAKDRVSFELMAYRLPETSLVEAGRLFAPVEHGRFDPAVDAWFAAGGDGPIPVEPDRFEQPACDNPSVTDVLTYQGGIRFSVLGAGPEDARCAAYAKLAFHPHFVARDARGRELPVLRAGVGMLVLAPPGVVRLQYELDSCEVAGQTLTVLALLALALLGGLQWRSRRSRGSKS
jgi:hypothetical protein